MTENLAKGSGMRPPPVSPTDRPEWAALSVEPADGWRVYADMVGRRHAALRASVRGSWATHVAAACLTRPVVPPRRMVEIAEALCGYRLPWAGAAYAVGEPGMRWRPASADEIETAAARAVYALPVWDARAAAEALDVVTWPADRPDRWARLNGLGDLLGAARLEAAHMGGGPLRIYPTPEAWLAGEESWPGVCVLHNSRDAGRDVWRQFEGIDRLVCDGPEHAAAVHKLTRRAPKRALPDVHFVKGEE